MGIRSKRKVHFRTHGAVCPQLRERGFRRALASVARGESLVPSHRQTGFPFIALCSKWARTRFCSHHDETIVGYSPNGEWVMSEASPPLRFSVPGVLNRRTTYLFGQNFTGHKWRNFGLEAKFLSCETYGRRNILAGDVLFD